MSSDAVVLPGRGKFSAVGVGRDTALFQRLFGELDGSPFVRNPSVTIACMNQQRSQPGESPTFENIHRTVSQLHQLIELEAQHARRMIQAERPGSPSVTELRNNVTSIGTEAADKISTRSRSKDLGIT